ncbi:MAG: flippase-like domain-containing protein [Chloroflexi bacterium]|nr:flippase-like domain-containing protein [Chloroflexota bacterium]
MQHLSRKISISLLLALAVFIALTFYADAPRLFAAIATFQWQWLALALAATLVNYCLRFVRWHYYLSVIGIQNIPARDSLLIFLTGFSLTMTPGKLGELLKSFLLKGRYGTPVSHSAPIVVAERLTDVLGMVLLAAIGLAVYPLGASALAVVVIAAVVFVAVAQSRALAERVLDFAARLPVIARFAGLIRNLYESAFLLLRLKPLLIAIALSTIAWFAECVTLLIVAIGLGSAPTPELLLQVTFIYAAASLFGAASMLPGGLGATEGGMAFLLEQIVALAREHAVAATFIVRLCTLWFAVLLGLIAALILGIPQIKFESAPEA